MHNLAPKNDLSRPTLEYGEVVSHGNDGFVVAVSFGAISAQQAAGCLLRPEPGDLVLLSLDASGLSYILSVLERHESNTGATHLHFENNLNISAPNIVLSAEQTNCLVSGEETALVSPKLSVTAEHCDAHLEKTSFFGRVVKAQAKTMQLVAHTVEHIFTDLTQRLQNSTRLVEEHEEVQAKNSAAFDQRNINNAFEKCCSCC